MGQTLRYCQPCRRDTWQNDTYAYSNATAYWCTECQASENAPERVEFDDERRLAFEVAPHDDEALRIEVRAYEQVGPPTDGVRIYEAADGEVTTDLAQAVQWIVASVRYDGEADYEFGEDGHLTIAGTYDASRVGYAIERMLHIAKREFGDRADAEMWR